VALLSVAWETGFITYILDCTAFTAARGQDLLLIYWTVALSTVARDTGFINNILDCTAFYCSEADRIYY
jgi:hypothetical protein